MQLLKARATKRKEKVLCTYSKGGRQAHSE